MNMKGVILQFAYRLNRHMWLAWSLSRWIGLLLVVAAVAALIHWWPRPWPAAVVGGLFLGYLVVLGWAARRRYIYFEATPHSETLVQSADSAPALSTEEWVPVRASGLFTVEGKERYYVDLEADFETVGTREHIVLARVHPSRFLLLGEWPSLDLGWWYMFFQPAAIRDIEMGHLHFGAQPRPALRLSYSPDGEKQEMIYLASEDVVKLRRIWNDLLQDARVGEA